MSKKDGTNSEPLDALLCFQLYLGARSAMKAYQPTLDSVGLTYPQYLVMFLLWNAKSVSVKKLGQDLGLDSGTLSPLIKKLVEKGLVTKGRDPEDERGVLVSATKAGSALETKTRCMPEVLAKASKLDHEKYLSLIKPLTELNRAMRESLDSE